MFTDIFAKFINFEFNSKNESTNVVYDLYRNVVWWQRYERLNENLRELIDCLNPDDWAGELGLITSCISLYSDDIDLRAEAIGHFRKNCIQNVFLTAFEIEISGRNQQYAEHAKLVIAAADKYGGANWVAYFCFISLSFPTARTDILLKKLDINLVKLSDSWLMLRARLLSGIGEIDLSISLINAGIHKWKHSGKLYWLRENIRGQAGLNPISAEELIEVFPYIVNQLDMPLIRYWFGIMNSFGPDFRLNFLYEKIETFLELVKDDPRSSGEIAAYSLIGCWLDGKYNLAHNILSRYHYFHQLPEKKEYSAAQIFMRYILALLIYWQNNRLLFAKGEVKRLVIGESHSLSLANLRISDDGLASTNSEFIMGIRMFDLAVDRNNVKKSLFIEIIDRRNSDIDLVITIGEIDCRPDGGIFQYSIRTGVSLDVVVKKTVSTYVQFLENVLTGKKFKTISLQGVPAPFHAINKIPDNSKKSSYLKMIASVNNNIEEQAKMRGWRFVDVYVPTSNDDGESNKKWHIDGYHIQPGFYVSTQAFQN